MNDEKSTPLDILGSLSLSDLRRLVAFKENQDQIAALMEKRDRLLDEARRAQDQIDDLLAASGGRGRRRRPSVKELCEEVLRGKKGGLPPAEVKNAILEKHPHRANRTFYNQVFIALRRNAIFRKLKSGRFILAE